MRTITVKRKKVASNREYGAPPLINMSKANPALLAAVSKAQGLCKTVAKNEKHAQRGYKYSSTEEVVRATRKPMEDSGLGLLVTWKPIPIEVPISDSIGNQFVCATVHIDWVLTHEEGGYISGSCEMDAIGSSARPTDKAVAATFTYARGFILCGLFNLDRDEEPGDAPDRRDDDREGFEPRRRQERRKTVDNRPAWEAYLEAPPNAPAQWYLDAYKNLAKAAGILTKEQWSIVMDWLGTEIPVNENVKTDPKMAKAVWKAFVETAKTVPIPEITKRAMTDHDIEKKEKEQQEEAQGNTAGEAAGGTGVAQQQDSAVTPTETE